MTIQQFIERAIEGEYKEYDLGNYLMAKGEVGIHEIAWLFLDPEAWKAVGEMEGWDDPTKYIPGKSFKIHQRAWPNWKANMVNMGEALAEGKTIESYLEAL